MVVLILAIAAVAALAVLPLWRAAGPVRLRGWAFAFSALAAATVVTSAVAHVAADRPAVPAERPIEVLAEGYVGSAACRKCHPAEHASWHGSFHRTMTQVVSRDALVAAFDTLTLDWFGEPVLLEWRGDELWTEFRRKGRRPADVERPIEQITGSHNLQVLWYSTGEGREIAPLPVCYKIEEAIWLPLTAVFVLPPEFRDPPEPGAWSNSCTMCHATDARPRVDIGRNDTHIGEFGISCEACHGPGAGHAEHYRSPLARWGARSGDGDAHAIVNPATLPPARSAEACGQCHSVSILRARHFDSWREHGSPFLPGQDLQSTHLVIDVGDRDAPELRRELRKNPNFFRSSFWPDGQVRLSGREFSGVRRSPCYAHGDLERQMDCTSCHAMHTERGTVTDGWRAGQMLEHARDNTACTQCHEDLRDDDALSRHTHHAPTSRGSSCYDCHMGYTSIGLMKASRSHEITSPDVAVELATGRPNACNQCHLDRTLQWTAEQLADGWGIAAPELADDQREVAAGVRWLLAGDAGQRMLAAWSFGWQPAQEAAGRDWLAPYLARLLDDPYYVVRFNAARSLRTLGDYDNALGRYDFLDDGTAGAFVDNVTALWQSRYDGAPRRALLLDDRGLRHAAFDRLYARRDDRPVYLAE